MRWVLVLLVVAACSSNRPAEAVCIQAVRQADATRGEIPGDLQQTLRACDADEGLL